MKILTFGNLGFKQLDFIPILFFYVFIVKEIPVF